MTREERWQRIEEAGHEVVAAYRACREANSMAGFWTHLDDLAKALSTPEGANAPRLLCRAHMPNLPVAYCALEAGHDGRHEFYMGTTLPPPPAPSPPMEREGRASIAFDGDTHDAESLPRNLKCPDCGIVSAEGAHVIDCRRAWNEVARPEAPRCPECEGTGETWTGSDWSGHKDCPSCGGSGRAAREP